MNIHFLPVSYRSTGVSTERSSQDRTFKHESGGSGSMLKPRLLRLTSCTPCHPQAHHGHLPFLLLFHPLPYLHGPWKIRPIYIYIYIYIYICVCVYIACEGLNYTLDCIARRRGASRCASNATDGRMQQRRLRSISDMTDRRASIVKPHET